MMTRIKNSWLLLGRSLSVLADNKKLLVFPIVTVLCMFVIVSFFFGAFLFQPTGHGYAEKAHWEAVSGSIFTQESIRAAKTLDKDEGKKELVLNSTGVVLSAFIYFMAMFLATFFNVAFYHEIIEALNGRPISLKSGFSFALSRIMPILFWSFFAGAVGYLIKIIEEKTGFVGKIVANLIGLAWSVAAIFAIPVMICRPEMTSPFSILKASAMSIKKTWGEALVGFVGLQAGVILVVFGSLIPFSVIVLGGIMLELPLISAIGAVAWFIFIFLFSYMAGVAGNVYQCALYMFAASGAVPSGYSREMMDLGWKRKS